jgi:glycosyltransferase involved in cell wall biosynthesis
MDLQAHAKNVGRLLPPLVNAWLAPGMSRIVPGKRPMDAPYFVILGTIEPRKNHWLMLQLWRGLIEQMGAQAPRLVVIGQRGWECENVVDMLERCKQLNGFLEEHPACSDEQLITFLHHAQALLFPSFAEGFGMPLVEALAHGLPVIASDLPVFREIAGNIPEYIAPLDGKRWSERVIEYAKPVSPLRQAQLRRMEGYIAPTWAEHFAKVDELMEQLNRTDGLS